MARDTLAYTKRLEAAGIERRHAEAYAEAANIFLPSGHTSEFDAAAYIEYLINAGIDHKNAEVMADAISLYYICKGR